MVVEHGRGWNLGRNLDKNPHYGFLGLEISTATTESGWAAWLCLHYLFVYLGKKHCSFSYYTLFIYKDIFSL
jgi:hypothetical protein